jgi:beta-mannosidase
MFASLWSAFAISWGAQIVLAQNIVDFRHFKWHLTNSDGNVSIPATYPSQAHLDLFAAGVTADPLYGMGDFDQLWVQRANWTYSTVLSGL